MKSNTSKSGRGAGGSGGGGKGGGEPPGGGGRRGGRHPSGGGPKPKKGEEGYESDESTHNSSVVERIVPRASEEYDELTPNRRLGQRLLDSLNTIPPRFGRNLLIGVLVVLFIGIHMRLIFGSDEENARGNDARRTHNLNFLRIFTGTLNGGSGTFSSSDVESLYEWLVAAGIIPRRLGAFKCNDKPYFKDSNDRLNERTRERIEEHVRNVELMDLVYSIFHGGIARVVENAMNMGDILNSAMVEANAALSPARLFQGFVSELGELQPTGNATIPVDYETLEWNQTHAVPQAAAQPAAAHGRRRRAVANNSSVSSDEADCNPVGQGGNARRGSGNGREVTNDTGFIGAGGNVGGGTTSVLGKRNASNLQGSTGVSPPLSRRRSNRNHPSSRLVDKMLSWNAVDLTSEERVNTVTAPANDTTNARIAHPTGAENVSNTANDTTKAQPAGAENVSNTANDTTKAQPAGAENVSNAANDTTKAQPANAGNVSNAANDTTKSNSTHANNASNAVAAGSVVRKNITEDDKRKYMKKLSEWLRVENERPMDPKLRFGAEHTIIYSDLMALTPSQRLNNESLAGKSVTTKIRERGQAVSVMPDDGVTERRWRTLTFGTIYRIDGRNGLLMNPQTRNFYGGMRGTISCKPSCVTGMNKDSAAEKHDWKTDCTKCGIEGGCIICNIKSEDRTDIFAAVCDWCYDAMMKLLPRMENYYMCPQDGCSELLGLDFRIFCVGGVNKYRCKICTNKCRTESTLENRIAPTPFLPFRRLMLNGTRGERFLTENYNHLHPRVPGAPNIVDPMIDFRHPSRTYRSADEFMADQLERDRIIGSANDVDDEISNISHAVGAASSAAAPSPDAASNHEPNASSAAAGNAVAGNASIAAAANASSAVVAGNASNADASPESSAAASNASKAPDAASNASQAPAAAAAEASSESSATASNASKADAAAATEASDSNQPQTPTRPVGAAAARSAGSSMIISPNGDGVQGNDQMNISPAAPVDGDDGQEDDTMIVTLRPNPRRADTRQEDGQRNAAPVDGDGGQANDQIVVRLNVDPPRLEADAGQEDDRRNAAPVDGDGGQANDQIVVRLNVNPGQEDDQRNTDAASLETDTQIVDLHTQGQAGQQDEADIHNQQGLSSYDDAIEYNCSEVGMARKELEDCEKSVERRKLALDRGLSAMRDAIRTAHDNIFTITGAMNEAEKEIMRLRRQLTEAKKKLAFTARPSDQTAAMGPIDISAIQDSQQMETASRRTAYDMARLEVTILESKINALERSNSRRADEIQYEEGEIRTSESRKRGIEQDLNDVDDCVKEAKAAYDHAVCVENAKKLSELSTERNAKKQAEAQAAAKAAEEKAAKEKAAKEKAAVEAAVTAAVEAAVKAAFEAAAKAAAEAAAAAKAAAAAEAAKAERLRRNAEINRPLIIELERNTDDILIDLNIMDNMMRGNFRELVNEEARRIFNTEPAVDHTMDTEDILGLYRRYFETDETFMDFVRCMFESSSRMMNRFETVRARLRSDAGTMGHGEGDSDSMPPSSDGGLSRVSSAGGLSRVSSAGGLSRVSSVGDFSRGRSASRGRRVSRRVESGVSNERTNASDEGDKIDGTDVSDPTDDSVRERDLIAMRRRLGVQPESTNVANTFDDFIDSISVGGSTSFAQNDLDPHAPDFTQRSSDRFRHQYMTDLLHTRRIVGGGAAARTARAENQDNAITASTRGWGALDFRIVPVRGELVTPAPAPAPALDQITTAVRPRPYSRRRRNSGCNADSDDYDGSGSAGGSGGSGGAGSSGGSRR